MTANLCVESTGHAKEEGYDVTFLADAIGSENVPSYEASVTLDFPLIGNAVMKVDEFLAATEGPAGGTAQVRPHGRAGDTVRGSDNLKIGKIEEVVAATDKTDAYLRVRGPHLLVLRKNIFIPLGAVVRRAGNDVFINVPGLVVPTMPWAAPPSRIEQRAKYGPPAREVEKLYRSRSPSAHEQSARKRK